MTKTSTQTTPGAERAASPRRSAPEAILEQCLDNGGAGTERGGKDGPQAGVEVQSTARQCVPTALDGSGVIERRPRSKTPPESSRWSMSGDQVAPDGSRVVRRCPRSPRRLPDHDSGARIDSGGRRPPRFRRRSTAPATASRRSAQEIDPSPPESFPRGYGLQPSLPTFRWLMARYTRSFHDDRIQDRTDRAIAA